MPQIVAFAGPAGPAFSFSAFLLPVCSPSCVEGLAFSHPGSPLFWIRSQLGHTGPTGPVWGFAGVVSLLGPQNCSQALTRPSLVSPPFFPAFLGGSPANSRYAYTAISPALNPRMKISLGRKDSPCRGFLLQVLLIFSAGLLPIFRIPFCEAFSLFTPPQILRRPIPRFWVSKRPGAILPSHKDLIFHHVLVKAHQDAGSLCSSGHISGASSFVNMVRDTV